MSESGTMQGSGGRLQPRASLPVPASWLTEFGENPEARRLAVLAADNAMLDRLMWSGWVGPEWEMLRDRLIAYGYQVLYAWLRKGAIFKKCEDRGALLLPSDACRDQAEAASLAGETVVTAVRKFRDTVLIPRVWRPDGRAALDSFFVGQCLIRFPNVYRRWLREHGIGGADALGDTGHRRGPPIDEVPLSSYPTSTQDSAARLILSDYMSIATDPTTKEILAYVADAYTYEEIAILTGLTVSNIKSRVYRLRRTARKL